MTNFEIIVLVLASLLGSVAAWLFKKKSHSSALNILLSFSGSYLLGVVVLHLLPEIFMHQEAHSGAHDHDALSGVAIFILIGFFIQLLIVQLTKGIEHGHLHLHEHFSFKYIFGVVFGLGIHAFIEGIPLATYPNGSSEIRSLYWGILIHKVPETFALGTLLFFSLKNKKHAILILFLFSLLTPFGSLIGEKMHTINDAIFYWLLAIVCGSLIHISTTIIFESSGKAHHISLIKFFVIIIGFICSMLTIFL